MSLRGTIYKNYVGQCYIILDTCKDRRTMENMIIYQELFGKYHKWVMAQSEFSRLFVPIDEISPVINDVSAIDISPGGTD